MAPFRNFLPKKLAVPTVVEPANDENVSPARSNGADTKSRSSLSIRRSADEEPNEYKMSVVNDSGVYLPPSPPERKSFWPSFSSRNSSNHRSLLNESEPFSISRESFDSYRRSFDISARSPVRQPDSFPSRISLDSRTSRPPLRSATNGSSVETSEPTNEEQFEDVGLNDEVKPKKRGLFSRFGGDSNDANSSADTTRPSSAHRGFHIPGRKRGHSGQGAELGSMNRSDAIGAHD
ncbi:hypothetical protein FQN54_001394 [Arachnomyces sp. PD_36]|nr:hypothetical protein FQN54_001394 [Arachnomyces sp. PD_36]